MRRGRAVRQRGTGSGVDSTEFMNAVVAAQARGQTGGRVSRQAAPRVTDRPPPLPPAGASDSPEYKAAYKAAKEARTVDSRGKGPAGWFGRDPARPLAIAEADRKLAAVVERERLAAVTQGRVPGAVEGLRIAAGAKGYDKSTGALGPDPGMAMRKAQTPEQLQQVLDNAGAVITDPRFSAKAKADEDVRLQLRDLSLQEAQLKVANQEAALAARPTRLQTALKVAQDAKLLEDLKRQRAGLPIAGPNERIIWNPWTGDEQVAPMPGTPLYMEEQAKMASMEQMIFEVQRYMDLIDRAGPTGTQWTGELVSRLDRQRGEIVLQMVKAHELGVISPIDAELVLDGLINPTDLTENLEAMARSGIGGLAAVLGNSQKQTILAGYEQLRENWRSKIVTSTRAMPWLDVDFAKAGIEVQEQLFLGPVGLVEKR